MDPKLARGISRVIQRELARGAEDANAAAESMSAPALRWAVSPKKRPDPAAMNGALDAAVGRLSANPAVLDIRGTPFAPGRRDASLFEAHLFRAVVTRFGEDGQPFADTAWHVRARCTEAIRGLLSKERWCPSVLIAPHLIDRLVERRGHLDTAGLRACLADAAMLGSLHAMRHLLLEEVAFTQAAPVIVPAPGGVLLGGVDTVVSSWLGTVEEHRCDAHQACTRSHATRSETAVAACVQTYVDDALLSAEESAAVAGLRDWMEREGRDLMRTDLAASYGKSHRVKLGDKSFWLPVGHPKGVLKRIEEGFGPAYDRAASVFLHWRRRAERFGVDRRNLDAMCDAHERQEHPVAESELRAALEGMVATASMAR